MITVATGKNLIRDAYYTEARLIHTASNGTKIALMPVINNGVTQYSVSLDGGATWSAAASMPNSIDVGAAFHIELINDVLSIWTITVANRPTYPVNVRLYTVPFTANAFGTATAYDYTGPSLAAIEGGGATWDGTRWHVAYLGLPSTGGSWRYYAFTATGGAASATISSAWPVLGAVTSMNLVMSGSTLFATVADRGAGKVYVLPYLYAAGVYNLQATVTPEVAYSRTTTGLSAAGYLTGTILDLVIEDAGNLYAVRRLGSNSYGSAVPLGNGAVPQQFTYTVDPVNGAVVVIYPSTTNQPNGELYVVSRTGSSWSTAARVEGGDTSGYKWPSLSVVTGNVADLLWSTDVTAAEAVKYDALSTTGAPKAPTLVSPIGTQPNGSVTFIWLYGSVSPGDPQSAAQVQATPQGGTTWDSGKVTQGTQQMAYGGSSLPVGVPVTWQARTWDTTSQSGAGTVSPWSLPQVFTLQNGATVTITGVSGDPTSPTTIGSPQLAIDLSYAQVDGHAASQWQPVMYDAAGTATVQTGPWTTFGTPLADGTTTTVNWAPGLANGMDYLLAIHTRDAVSGVISESARWSIHTTWTPPASPTNLVCTVNGLTGRVHLAWDNPTAAVSNNLYSQVSGATAWDFISGGTLLTQAEVHVPVGIAHNFKVTAVDANGLEST